MAKSAQTRNISRYPSKDTTIAVFEGNGGQPGQHVFLDIGEGPGTVGKVISSDAGWSFAKVENEDGRGTSR